jgi:glycosyltransferase involved in cell wall biosynthesis
MHKKLNVLHIITDLQQGGAEAMLEKLVIASGSESPNVSHTVISLRSLGVVGPRLLSIGVPVAAMGFGQGLFSSVKALLKLWNSLQHQSSDTVVQTWLYHADLIGGLMARLVGLRNVHWNVRVAFNRSDLRAGTSIIVKFCAYLSKYIPRKIIYCGDKVRSSHLSQGYFAGNSTVIHNGFDTSRFQFDGNIRYKRRQELGIDDNDFVIGTVARLHPQKDYEGLAQAAAIVVRHLPRAKFLWIGANVQQDPHLSHLINGLGIEGHVVRLEQVERVEEYLYAMDLYCLGSRTEGFPNALGEAMMASLPCVATAAGDASSILACHEWIVPTGNPERLADTLLAMAKISGLERQKIGCNNRNRMKIYFDIRACWRNYLKFYEDSFII